MYQGNVLYIYKKKVTEKQVLLKCVNYINLLKNSVKIPDIKGLTFIWLKFIQNFKIDLSKISKLDRFI